MSRGSLARGRFSADMFERSLSTTTKVVVGIQWATTTTVVVVIERVTTTTVVVGIKWVTVFDLITYCSLTEFWAKKIALISDVCVYPGCKTLLPKIVACEGPLIMMTGYLKKKEKKRGVFGY